MPNNEFLKKLLSADNKKMKTNIIVLFLIGVLLMISGNTIFSDNNNQDGEIVKQDFQNNSESTSKDISLEKDIEKRLESILSNIEGAGEVKVMVSISQGEEQTVAEETKTAKTQSTENVAGGDKTSVEDTYENKVVIIEGKSGVQEPVVLKKSAAKVEGILVLAEGGDDISVKDGISKACQALFNVPAHKVEILKKK